MHPLILEEMKNLVEKLNKATEEYDKGTPIMTDEEWDNLYFYLVQLELENRYTLPNSPTQIIHSALPFEEVEALIKITHNHEMLSLPKTKDLKEVFNFLKGKEYIAMCKMDGLTCSLTYKDGVLVRAETRGDGFVGEDILHNAFVIKSIPKTIPCRGEVIIDGEIICSYDDFKQFEEDYKNPRNFAAGSIRLLNSKECSLRNLTFVAWDIIKGLDFGLEKKRFLSEKLLTLLQYDFTIVPFDNFSKKYSSGENIDLINLEENIAFLQSQAKRYGYPIDGIVFKFDDIDYGSSLGKTSHHFNNAIAYKFYDETYKTTVKDIEWTMGRTGVLTPVAILEPIEIDGATIERANCHNLSVLKELELKYRDQEVEIYRANQIIPQISKVYPYEYENASPFEIPEVCPICGEKTVFLITDGSKFLYCENPQCQGKLVNRLDHFCGKKGLDIKGLSKATLEKLINWGWVEEIQDLFLLEQVRDMWVEKPGFGIKSVNNILNSVFSARTTTLEKVISSIGIPLIGKTIAKDLANRFKTYDNFREHINKGFDFSQIEGYGPEMTKALLTFDYSELDWIVNNYLYLSTVEEVQEKDTLKDVTVVITGKLKIYKNREALKNAIEEHGGKVVDKITKKVNYLINNDINSTSAKNKTAKELGIPIISEEDFINKNF
jgi:DNA ligase (NAD+)